MIPKPLTTKERITQAATKEFMLFGYTNVTVDQIAKAAGVSKKTIYQHFMTKEDIFWEVVQCKKSERQSQFEEIHKMEIGFLEKMRLVGYRNAKNLCEAPIVFLKDLQRNAPDLFHRIETMKREAMVNGFAEFYKSGVKENYFRNDIPIDIASEMYYAMMSHMFTIAISSENHSLEELYDCISMIFFEGVFSREGFKKYNRYLEENENKDN
jgi:AcrR family transcriptional regulator